ncbi:hypothetical protein [Streptomyces erythrochromogenes]|uniref:hypothetical protein n=1 Tax=Streptomyces erythrochromogenes TaxID=285574 RepID=UPI00224D35B1|nr:hypothetical protein [Streptomyces erythrochromogenes]MCX5584028.1 hypothetical protein [Streptomyces erythrochromogenes]
MLAQLEGLIAELEHLTGEDRLLQLRARVIRAGLLIDEGRPAEAEAEAVLRVLTRTMYATDAWSWNRTRWCAWARPCARWADMTKRRRSPADTCPGPTGTC